MPLSSTTLTDGIRKFSDQDAASFSAFPQTQALAAMAFADAMFNYASQITPPLIGAGALPAKETMAASLALDMSQKSIEKELKTFALTFANGMKPSFTGTPPPAAPPLDLTPVITLGLKPPDNKSGASAEDCAKKMADIIDKWFQTGFSVTNTSPATKFDWR